MNRIESKIETPVGSEMEIERSSGNIYADLGFADAGQMLVKAQLVSKIAEILRARQWTQQQASKILGIPQPKLSKMLRGQFRGISESKLLECLTKLGRDVRIVIGSEQHEMGRIEVFSS